MRDSKKTKSVLGTVLTVAAVAGTAALAIAKRNELSKMTKDLGTKIEPGLKTAGTMVARFLAVTAHKMDPTSLKAANDPDQRPKLGADPVVEDNRKFA